MIVLYQGLNLKFLIQQSETLLVELTGTHTIPNIKLMFNMMTNKCDKFIEGDLVTIWPSKKKKEKRKTCNVMESTIKT